jgi:hypothetical protein
MTRKIRVLYEVTADGPNPVATYSNAVAVGGDTVATSEISIEMTSHGRVTITTGTVSATASSSASAEDTAYASVETKIVSASDILRTTTTTTSGSGETDGSSWWFDASSTHFFVIDIDGVDLGNGSLTIDRTSSELVVTQPEPIEGNVAALNIKAMVLVNDTYAEVQAEVLAVEDQLSTTSAMVLVA